MPNDGFSKCHPVVNFLFFAGAICFGVVFQHPAYLLAALGCSGLYYLLLDGHRALMRMALLLPLWLAVAAINPLFNTRGSHILFSLFGRPYTLEALSYSAAVGAILLITLIWFATYSRIMTADKFTAIFGNLIPALSLLLVMIFRLVPRVVTKAGEIAAARRSIGLGTDSSRKGKLREGMTVLLCLTGWALEGSILTADSMRSRGYGCARRTRFQIFRMHKTDWILLGVLLAACAILIWGSAVGAMDAEFVPLFSAAPLSAFFPVYCLFLLIPSILHIKEVLLCRIFISKI